MNEHDAYIGMVNLVIVVLELRLWISRRALVVSMVEDALTLNL